MLGTFGGKKINVNLADKDVLLQIPGIRSPDDPEDLQDETMLDVVNAMDGEIFLLDCLKTSNACPRKERCMTARFWNDINETIRDKFRSITLKAILDQYISGKLNEETYSI